MRALLAAALCALLAGAARAAPRPRFAGAWVAPFDAFSSEDWACFDEIAVFALAFDEHGNVFTAYPDLLARAAAAKPAGTALVPVVVNDRFGPGGRPEGGAAKSTALLWSWLARGSRRDKHVESLAAAAAPYDGIELDYERVPGPLWDDYADLVEKLADKLHAEGKRLDVDLEYAPVYADAGSSARRAVRRIAAAADTVKVMAYYERGELADAPGPGASLTFVERTGRRALELIPADKAVLALTLAATDYEVPVPVLQTGRSARRLHFRAARSLLVSTGARPLWDDALDAPYFAYEKDGASHQVWYEDERTLGAKIAAAASLGEGVGLWYLGATRPDLRAMGLCR